jgi:hypothetical protein
MNRWMRLFVVSATFAAAGTARAEEALKFSLDMDSKYVQKLIDMGVYDAGGSREGRFQEDFQASASQLRRKEIDEFYGDRLIFQLADDDLYRAKKAALAEGNEAFRHGLRNFPRERSEALARELAQLEYDWEHRPTVCTTCRNPVSEEIKPRFITIMRNEFDARAADLLKGIESARSNDGSYKAALTQYKEMRKTIESTRVEHRWALFGTVSALFAGMFFGLF